MKIGLAVYECKENDLSFNLSQIEKALQEEKVDLLCFSEAFLQGFCSITFDYEKDIHIAQSQNSIALQKIKELSMKYNTAIAVGYFEKEEKDIYSSYILIEKNEIYHNYRRISKNWKESDINNPYYKEGKTTSTFLFHGKEFNIALCGDMWIYPERFKTEEILLWPVYVNFDLDDKEMAEYAKQANLVAKYALVVNAISKKPDSKGGAFYCKEGQIIRKLELEKQGVLVIEM